MARTEIADELVVNAQVAEVWEAIADPAVHAHWHPFVIEIDGEHEAGAIRSCSVLVGAKSGRTTERCVEFDEPRSVTWRIEEDSTGFNRMVSDWHAGFTLQERDGATLVTAHSAFQPSGMMIRIVGPVVRRKFHQTQRAILAGLKSSVEAQGD
jgi:uncharacterized protein YndB with AHSA1/START domain